MLPCPYSDMTIAATGEINSVKAEFARSELELLKILEENGINSFEALHVADVERKELTDPQIFDIIMFVIKDLDAEGKIYCRCKNDGEGDFEVEVLDDGIKISCKKCGAILDATKEAKEVKKATKKKAKKAADKPAEEN